MATRRPFWKWHIWKSIAFFPYTLVMWYWRLDLIFKANQKLEYGNRKIQDGRQAAILKVTSLKITRLLPMATNIMHMKFQIEIPKQSYAPETMSRTDGRTDGQGTSSKPPHPHPTPGGMIKVFPKSYRDMFWSKPLQWRHNEHNDDSNHHLHECLLNRLFRRRSKKTSQLRVTGLCEGNSPVTGEFPAQRSSNALNVSIWWRHHVLLCDTNQSFR